MELRSLAQLLQYGSVPSTFSQPQEAQVQESLLAATVSGTAGVVVGCGGREDAVGVVVARICRVGLSLLYCTTVGPGIGFDVSTT